MKVTRVAFLIACLAFTGCVSPETRRTRGDGPGGDVGNRSPAVRMHEGSDPYWLTPDRTPGAPPPLRPARQARDHSRR